jgi:hypothetical protein
MAAAQFSARFFFPALAKRPPIRMSWRGVEVRRQGGKQTNQEQRTADDLGDADERSQKPQTQGTFPLDVSEVLLRLQVGGQVDMISRLHSGSCKPGGFQEILIVNNKKAKWKPSPPQGLGLERRVHQELLDAFKSSDACLLAFFASAFASA